MWWSCWLLSSCVKLIPDWFVTSKLTKILVTAFYADENILYFNKDSGSVVFTCYGMGILNKDLNNINFGDTNYDEDDPDVIIVVRFLAWHSKLAIRKALKKHKRRIKINSVVS